MAAMGPCLLLVVLVVACGAARMPAQYTVGVGMADITGPAAEVNMMGYANPGQVTGGLHLRQFSRAFIFNDLDSKNPVVFVSIDACMFSQGVKLEIIRRLKTKFGDVYNERNVAISGTHTHSGPGGFHQYILYDITSLGFVKETFDALVSGIVLSIERAHAAIKPANIYINVGELLDSNINRSPTAYLRNSPEERAKYQYDTDKNMTVLKIVDEDENPIAMLSWFAVHCTSMNNTNNMISSDNKGLAALMFEADINGQDVLPGKGKFVAGFGQSNLGDVSPNTKGPHCLDTGLPCDTNTSTCNGKNELCVAFGPGKDMFESTYIIGQNQYKRAMELFNEATIPLSGPVKFRHTYTDMTKQSMGQNKTCKPAMGYSFAAGTTDGPGAFNFKQSTTSSSPFWNVISHFIKKPSKEQEACQHPKPILLDTGEINFPYAWSPSIVDTQLITVGQLAIVVVPGEWTTMSGRRTRDAVVKSLMDAGFQNTPIPVIAGLANDYADYITTYEEYQQQRYEGASTIYGPHTLQAYIEVFKKLSMALASGQSVSPGPNPPDLIGEQMSLLPGVIVDTAGFERSFGQCIQQPEKQYNGGQRVTVKFVGANPRNNRRPEGTFLEVQFKEKSGNWSVAYTDAHWETMYQWKSVSVFGESDITIIWDIPADVKPGTYRIMYYGDKKSLGGDITAFTGVTQVFGVSQRKYKYEKLMKKKDRSRKRNRTYILNKLMNAINIQKS